MNARLLPGTAVTMAGFVGALVFAVLIIGSVAQTTSSAQENAAKASLKKRPTYFPNTKQLAADHQSSRGQSAEGVGLGLEESNRLTP